MDIKIQRNLPTIFTGASVIGVGLTTVLAARTAVNIDRAFPDENLKPMDYIRKHWKSYIPALLAGLATCGCSIAANKLSASQIATLTAGAALITKNYDRYKDSVKRALGEENVKKIEEFMAREVYKENPIAESSDKGGDTLFFDEFSGRFFTSTKENVYAAILEANRKFAMDKWCSLNDFYEFLGIETIEVGEDLGWSKETGEEFEYNFIDFEFELTNLRPNAAPEDVDGYIIRYPYCPSFNYKNNSHK